VADRSSLPAIDVDVEAVILHSPLISYKPTVNSDSKPFVSIGYYDNLSKTVFPTKGMFSLEYAPVRHNNYKVAVIETRMCNI